MSKLKILCPGCIMFAELKTELEIEYDSQQGTIKFQCPVCQNYGEFKRVAKQPNLFIRIIQAIKRLGVKQEN